MAGRVISVGGRARGRLAPRRSTQWIASTAETAVSTLAAASVVLDQSFAFAEPATVIRIRGQLWIRSDTLSASEEPFGAIGMAVVTDQALAIGVTAVPTPITDQSSDNWFLWQPFAQSIAFLDATGMNFNRFAQFELESKAMRKVDDGKAVVVVLENASAAHGMVYLMEFRMLVKLHG